MLAQWHRIDKPIRCNQNQLILITIGSRALSSPELTQAALDLTFKAVKPHHPSLALKVQNLMAGKRNIQESYPIDLGLDDIRLIISSLAIELKNINDPGMLVVMSALLEDWESFLHKA